LGAFLALSTAVQAQTATQTLNFDGTSSFSGALGGTITGTVLGTSSAQINITDLDVRTVSDGGFLNVFPNSSTTNNTATIPIAVNPSSVNITIPTTNFSSPLTGSFDVTAGDNLANGVVGALDGGVPGSDGKWDDPLSTGILNNATASNFQGTLTNAINAPANVSGGISASVPSNVTIPNVIDTSIIDADLIVKNSSNVQVNFSPAQNISLQNLSLGATTPVSLNNPASGNFVDGAHPVPGASATLDLSAGGADLVSTTITGTIVSDIMGTITGSIDLAAAIKLPIIGTVGTFDIDNVIDGELSDGEVSLIDLNEDISLSDTELPFVITVLHEANTDVDFDDVAASIASGTLGLSFPISITQSGVAIDLPATTFEESGLSFHVNQSGQKGTVYLDHLAASISGTINLDLAANLTLQADLLANAFQSAAINVVPEPGSVLLMAFAGIGLIGYGIRRRRK
jgi:hypothetical protein